MKCKNCGKTLQGNANFCHNCGWDITNGGSQIRTVRFFCKGCNAAMQISTESQIVRCPCCGSTELIIENDDVTIERIRSKTILEHQKHEHEQEREKLDRENKSKARTEKNDLKFFIIGFSFMIVFFVVTIGMADGFFDKDNLDRLFSGITNKISFPMSYRECTGKPYTMISLYVSDAGFTNVQTRALNDLSEDEMEQNGLVYQIMVNGDLEISSDTYVPRDTPIIIYYHSPLIE